jgi:hypothetical protein
MVRGRLRKVENSLVSQENIVKDAIARRHRWMSIGLLTIFMIMIISSILQSFIIFKPFIPVVAIFNAMQIMYSTRLISIEN